MRHKRTTHPKSANSREILAKKPSYRRDTMVYLENFKNPAYNPNPQLLDRYRIELHQNNRIMKSNFIDVKVSFLHPTQFPEEIGFGELVNMLHGVFQNIFAVLTRYLKSWDLVRVVMLSPYLDPPCSLPFLPLSELSAEVCSSAISAILNSKEEFNLDQFFIHFVSTERPQNMGGKPPLQLGKRKKLDLEKFFKNKRSIVTVPEMDDYLCAGRALLGSLKILKKDKKVVKNKNIHRYLKNKSLTKEAKLLYKERGENYRKRGNLDTLINLFKHEMFSQIRGINIFAVENGLERVLHMKTSRSPTGLQYINLLQLNNHYHIVQNVPALFGSKVIKFKLKIK